MPESAAEVGHHMSDGKPRYAKRGAHRNSEGQGFYVLGDGHPHFFPQSFIGAAVPRSDPAPSRHCTCCNLTDLRRVLCHYVHTPSKPSLGTHPSYGGTGADVSRWPTYVSPPSLLSTPARLDTRRTPPSWRRGRGAASEARPRIQFKQWHEITHSSQGGLMLAAARTICPPFSSTSRNLVHALLVPHFHALMTPPTAGRSMKKDRKLRIHLLVHLPTRGAVAQELKGNSSSVVIMLETGHLV
ncbi:hypothetical protein C8J57DRAFT_1246924 [Mycena rebaudengoi]|nr:hypothetical protein C8J57DRAFT_1246924 [Mycena rebaudengoi]